MQFALSRVQIAQLVFGAQTWTVQIAQFRVQFAQLGFCVVVVCCFFVVLFCCGSCCVCGVWVFSWLLFFDLFGDVCCVLLACWFFWSYVFCAFVCLFDCFCLFISFCLRAFLYFIFLSLLFFLFSFLPFSVLLSFSFPFPLLFLSLYVFLILSFCLSLSVNLHPFLLLYHFFLPCPCLSSFFNVFPLVFSLSFCRFSFLPFPFRVLRRSSSLSGIYVFFCIMLHWLLQITSLWNWWSTTLLLFTRPINAGFRTGTSQRKKQNSHRDVKTRLLLQQICTF